MRPKPLTLPPLTPPPLAVQADLALLPLVCRICIWSPGLDTSLDSDHGPAMSPAPGYGLAETIATGHRGNIFGLAAAPGLSTRLLSCAADAQVRVYDLSSTSNPRLNPMTVTPPPDSPHKPWVHHELTTACTTVLRCHTERVKRIATEASSDVFLTCAEDGTVRCVSSPLSFPLALELS